METLQSPFGELQLSRWPQRKNDVLRAWDAADEYLLDYLAEQNLAGQAKRILIINDGFGALSCALQAYPVTSWGDSTISHLATAENLSNNGSGGAADADATDDVILAPEYLKSIESPTHQYDLVVIKIPKTMALLEDQLIKLKPQLTENARLVAGGMIKHLPKSAFQLFEKHIGSLTTSLAKKKARLLFVEFDQALPSHENPYPSTYTDELHGLTLSNHANLFSRDHLDFGARFLLAQFSQLPEVKQVIDLGCGNGILGIKYQQLHADANVQFVDESYMAIASAATNYANVIKAPIQDANFRAEDGLKQTADDSIDLILCNPPFHQQHVIGEQIAVELFNHSKRCLQVGGELWIVANRHLDYQGKLKRLFGNCRIIDSNKKFVVLRVVKR